MDTNEVNGAFEILLEELEALVKALNEDGSGAFKSGNYEKAQELIQDATRLTDFHDKVKNLQSEWQTLFAPKAPKRKTGKRTHRGRLSRGLRTPEEVFVMPILETLVEMGGSAPMKKVLVTVGKKMKDVLNKHDRERLSSAPTFEIRWRNTVEWCRYKMVRDGLLKGDSPRGVWEITDKGRKTLEQTK